jgi:hypothetical protein
MVRAVLQRQERLPECEYECRFFPADVLKKDLSERLIKTYDQPVYEVKADGNDLLGNPEGTK